MTTVLEVGGPAGSAPAAEGSRRGRRRWIALAIAVAVAVTGGAFVLRHRPVTPEQFVTFAQELDTLRTPAGAWTMYDPTTTGYAAASPEGWSIMSGTTWVNMADPTSWVAVRGWQTTVRTSAAPAACREAIDWLSAAATTLRLSESDPPLTVARCEAVATTTTTAGAVSDTWAGQGMQQGDGELRYRTGSVTRLDGADPGHVTIAVIADASAFGR